MPVHVGERGWGRRSGPEGAGAAFGHDLSYTP